MKRISVSLIFLLITSFIIAQKKTLPNCPTLTAEIEKIHSTFNEMVLNAKVNTDYPELTICAISGFFETVEGNATFNFDISDEDYAGKKAAFDALFQKILAALKIIFSATHEIKNDESTENRSWYFIEKGKNYDDSKINIYLRIYYIDLLMETPANSINLEFRARLK